MLTFAALIMSIVVSEYIQKLNDAQREAVVNFRCPSLIVAGAGSGKTRVLTCRIAYMLEQGVAPDTILALTFTNKAAAEMRERIGQLLSPQATRRIWMGTFHSLFSRILRAEADKLGYPSSYTIYDASDARNLVKQIIREMNLSDETYKPGDIAARISLAKNNLITPGAYEANASLSHARYARPSRRSTSPALIWLGKPPSSSTTPSRSRTAVSAVRPPSTRTSPLSGRTRSSTVLMSVVLPAPRKPEIISILVMIVAPFH